MGNIHLIKTDETTYNCKICDSQIAMLQNMLHINYQHYSAGVCFCFADVMNTVTTGNFPMDLIISGSFIIIDDAPLPDINNILSNNIHCKACNMLLGWKIENKNLIIKNRIH